MTELKLKGETVERERDFYFDKLRDIEILCQAPELQSVPVSAYECILVWFGCTSTVSVCLEGGVVGGYTGMTQSAVGFQ